MRQMTSGYRYGIWKTLPISANMYHKNKLKYTKEILEDAVDGAETYAEVARKFGLAPHGGSTSYLKNRCIKFEVDTSHFKGVSWAKGKKFPNRRRGWKSADKILVMMKPGSNRQHAHQLRRALIEIGISHKCSVCDIGDVWNGSKLTLEVDHVDCNYLNNKADNLRFLCPNCHSQTGNYRNKKRKTNRTGAPALP